MGYGKLSEDQIRILEDLPGSAVELQSKDKVSSVTSTKHCLQLKQKMRFQFLRKLQRQERVVEEVKLVLKPHYNKKHITKEDYKEILRRAVPKVSASSCLIHSQLTFNSIALFQVCHNRTGEINPKKIHKLVEAYVKKFRIRRKQINPAANLNK